MIRQESVERHSGRSLLLTVLGEFVRPGGGVAWTSALVAALASVGVEEKAARQALARTAERGLLTAERVGRRTRWRLTPSATQLLTEGAERIYRFHVERPAWDRRWVLVAASVPERRRDVRYRLARRLGWAGFAPIGPGLWLSPWVDRQSEAAAVVAELGLADSARSFVGAPGEIGDTNQLVEQAWDLDAIGAEYRTFTERFGACSPRHDEARFHDLTLLVHEWRRLPFVDPDLPRELLPARWAGDRAAALFHRLHDRWSPGALRWWAPHTCEGC